MGAARIAQNTENNSGITIIGGGYKYFSNAWVVLRLLRQIGSTLPVQIWLLDEEKDLRISKWIEPYEAEVRILAKPKRLKDLPRGALWQWMLKPWALLNSGFRETLLLDADSFPVRNPEYLLECAQFKDTGAVFWPDLPISYRTGPENSIWSEMGIPFRHEREFESGQMLVNVEQHREPLELALEMNLQAAKYYQMLWGDKDTFRFAFHKFGRRYSMTPHPVEVPGGTTGVGVMCQQDFSGQ